MSSILSTVQIINGGNGTLLGAVICTVNLSWGKEENLGWNPVQFLCLILMPSQWHFKQPDCRSAATVMRLCFGLLAVSVQKNSQQNKREPWNCNRLCGRQLPATQTWKQNSGGAYIDWGDQSRLHSHWLELIRRETRFSPHTCGIIKYITSSWTSE